MFMKRAEYKNTRIFTGKPFGRLIAGYAGAIAIIFGFIFSPTLNAAIISCPNIEGIEQVFLSQHINYKEENDALEVRVIDQYIKSLDPAKIYLLESDVKSLKEEVLKGLFAKVRKANCSVIDIAHALYLKRVEERSAYAKKTLSAKKFKFDPKTELTIDPEKRKYPKNTAEADTFQGKYLQFQISNYLATGMKQDEAQSQVIRNYERIVKRIKETSKEDLYSSYLDSFGRALDPHSSFFSRDSLEDFEISMGLSLEGIGASLSSQDGFTIVEQLIDGGSAKGSGLIQPQDKIVAVGQFKPSGEVGEMENVVEMDLRDVVRKIRGAKGSKVRLMLLRKATDGKAERFTADLVRDKIKLEEEAATLTFQERDLNGEKKKIAVLNLPSFYAEAKRGGRSSASDMKKLLKEVREKKSDAMVLDLSMDGGGSLDDAVKIAGLFFKTGNVVKQSSRDPQQGEATLADIDNTVDWDGPLVVLTSRISASASEIVSGTLKDYNRAVIVGGDHTFGKGSVQSVVPLPPGMGAVKVTVGMFFTPGGYSTQHRGVEADVVLPGPFSTDEIGEKSLDYSLPPKQLKPFLSPDAYVVTGPGAWKKVDAATITQLQTRSSARVSKNAEFQKIVAEMKKNKEKSKVIKLSEAQKDTKEKKDEADQKKKLNKDEKSAEYNKRADVQEAVNVAADLLSLQKGVVLNASSDTGMQEGAKKTH
jgi:carboxyl-terminal processing protease